MMKFVGTHLTVTGSEKWRNCHLDKPSVRHQEAFDSRTAFGVRIMNGLFSLGIPPVLSRILNYTIEILKGLGSSNTVFKPSVRVPCAQHLIGRSTQCSCEEGLRTVLD